MFFVGDYSNAQRILLIGEGNFTFSAALSIRLGGGNIWATSLDSNQEVIAKYGSVAKKALNTLKSTGAHVLHGIDVTKKVDVQNICQGVKLNDEKSSNQNNKKQFDVIIFNFPHCGRIYKGRCRNE